MAALRRRCGHPILQLYSFCLSSFSSPILSGRRLDVYHTSTRDVALVRIKNACLKCAAPVSLKIREAKITPRSAICAPSHNSVALYLRKEDMHRQSKKTSWNRNICSTCPHNMVNFRPLTAEIGSLVLGTPANFNGFRVASLLQRRRSTEVNQTLHDVWPSRWLLSSCDRTAIRFDTVRSNCLVMATLRSRCGHYIFALWFLLSSSSFFLFSSPNLSRRRLDVCHTCTHGVALV